MPRVPAASAFVMVAGLLALGAAAWRAATVPGVPPLAEAERRDAVETVRLHLALSAHLRGSGGDPRYAERLPAEARVVDEILREIEYRRHGGHQEEPRLVRMEVRDARPLDAERVEVRTKEYWITREIGSPDGGARSDVVLAHYLLRRDSGAWHVADWDLDVGAEAR